MEMIHLKIELVDAKPSVIREVAVPSTYSFAQLHEVIQVLFGWDDEHLYEFYLPFKKMHIVADEESSYSPNTEFCLDVLLEEVLKPRNKFTYIYDFGDHWVHEITVGKMTQESGRSPYLITWTGENACEDCGGIDRYNQLVKEKDEYLENRNEFDEMYIQLRFEEMEDEYEMETMQDPDFETIEENLEPIFERIHNDTLFVMHTKEEVYPIWLKNQTMEEERCVYIFPSMEALAMHIYCSSVQSPSNFLFLDTLKISLPDDESFVEGERDALEETKIMRIQYGKLCHATQKEIEQVLNLCDFLLEFSDATEKDIEEFPNLSTDYAIHCYFDGDTLEKIDFLTQDIVLTMPSVQIAKERVANIKQNNAQKLNLQLLAVPDMEDSENINLICYLASYHHAYEELYQMKADSFPQFLQELIDHCISVFEQFGCPMYLEVNDARLFACLEPLCECLPCKLRMSGNEDERLAKFYRATLAEVNPDLIEDIENFIKERDEGISF